MGNFIHAQQEIQMSAKTLAYIYYLLTSVALPSMLQVQFHGFNK